MATNSTATTAGTQVRFVNVPPGTRTIRTANFPSTETAFYTDDPTPDATTISFASQDVETMNYRLHVLGDVSIPEDQIKLRIATDASSSCIRQVQSTTGYNVNYDSAVSLPSTMNITTSAGTDCSTIYTASAPYVIDDNATSSVVNWNSSGIVELTTIPKAQLIKDFIKQNLFIRSRRRSGLLSASPEEMKARDTLRDMISEAEWRRYVTNGFIMVKGKRGWYQIFPDQRMIKVYKDGKQTHRICIHTDRECPPTDHVINMKILIEFDEEQIWVGGNAYEQNFDLAIGLPKVSKQPSRLIDYCRNVAA